jgi:hypothetical protein
MGGSPPAFHFAGVISLPSPHRLAIDLRRGGSVMDSIMLQYSFAVRMNFF